MGRRAAVVVLAFLLDAVLGDPQNPWHPIRLIGSAIAWGIRSFEKAKRKSPVLVFLQGMLLSMFVIGMTYRMVYGMIALCRVANDVFAFVLEVVLCYFIIAAKALKVESMRVYDALNKGDIAEARTKLSYIVGRDAAELEVPEIAQAAVETVAENLSDGVIAPILYVLLGGVPLGFAYKAVNTLDSMIGYRNERFQFFGKFAAKLDDAVNFIPARISAVLMILAAFLTREDFRGAIRIFIRDRYKHLSPNSAQTEAVCAGALDLRLGGPHRYHGVMVEKPAIGDPIRSPEPKDIIRANKLMYVAAVLLVACAGMIGAFYV